jgi:motility quorum-sensing regulator/GCU-specific mRNA interferase toxin
VEKLKPAYDLAAFKSACRTVAGLRATGTAVKTAAALGFGRTEVAATIQTIKPVHFYKSMTSHGDHRIWQDVYHVPSEAGLLYVKFTASGVSEFLLLSFKEKGDG